MAPQTKRDAPGRPPSIDAPRETILMASARLFAEQGYEGTSLQDIASAVKFTKAGLYHYFASKQDIFDQIILKLLADMRARVEEQVAAQTTPADRLYAFMQAHAAFLTENLAEFRTMFGARGGVGQAYTPDQIAAREAYAGVLLQILREGQATGAFVLDDVAIPAQGILGMLNGMSRWYRPAGPGTASDIADGFFRMIHAGLSPRPAGDGGH